MSKNPYDPGSQIRFRILPKKRTLRHSHTNLVLKVSRLSSPLGWGDERPGNEVDCKRGWLETKLTRNEKTEARRACHCRIGTAHGNTGMKLDNKFSVYKRRQGIPGWHNLNKKENVRAWIAKRTTAWLSLAGSQTMWRVFLQQVTWCQSDDKIYFNIQITLIHDVIQQIKNKIWARLIHIKNNTQ